MLRATGETIAADQLESGDFARASAAVSAARARDDDTWEACLAAERKRIDDAQLLAELLVPLLAERLTDSLSTRFPVPGETGPSPAAAARKAKASRDRTTPSAPLEIADFIEGMLAQERAEVRDRATRQAS